MEDKAEEVIIRSVIGEHNDIDYSSKIINEMTAWLNRKLPFLPRWKERELDFAIHATFDCIWRRHSMRFTTSFSGIWGEFSELYGQDSSHCGGQNVINWLYPLPSDNLFEDITRISETKETIRRIYLTEILLQITNDGNYKRLVLEKPESIREADCQIFQAGTLEDNIYGKHLIYCYYPSFNEDIMAPNTPAEIDNEQESLLQSIETLTEFSFDFFELDHCLDFSQSTPTLKASLDKLQEMLFRFIYRFGFMDVYCIFNRPCRNKLYDWRQQLIDIAALENLLTNEKARDYLSALFTNQFLQFLTSVQSKSPLTSDVILFKKTLRTYPSWNFTTLGINSITCLHLSSITCVIL